MMSTLGALPIVKIGYLVHNLNDPAVERRCRMLERGGATVQVAGFVRDHQLRPDIENRAPLIIGRTNDADFIGRIVGAARAAAFDKKLRTHFSECNVIVARNLEQLAIARVIAQGRPIVYECLDIHRLLVGQSVAARAVQKVEATLLPHVGLLLTSSPAFVREHFAHRPLGGAVFLLENKLLIEGSERFAEPTSPRLPWRIGWFGMLRCHRTFDFLSDLAERSSGQIEVMISGQPSPAELPSFADAVARRPGLSFTGPYRYEDLADLYGAVHFAWTIDWFEAGLNSNWLLPNRIYEAVAHRTVPIALDGIEVGRWLNRRNIGLVVDSADQARNALLGMNDVSYKKLMDRVFGLPRSQVTATDPDCRELVDAIKALLP